MNELNQNDFLLGIGRSYDFINDKHPTPEYTQRFIYPEAEIGDPVLKLNKHERLVLSSIFRHAKVDKPVCYPGARRLADNCSINEHTVRAAVKLLEEKKLITVVKRTGISSVYHINMLMVDRWLWTYRVEYYEKANKNRCYSHYNTLPIDNRDSDYNTPDDRCYKNGSEVLQNTPSGVIPSINEGNKGNKGTKDIIINLIKCGIKEENAKKLSLRVDHKIIETQIEHYKKALSIDDKKIHPGLLFAASINNYKESWWKKTMKKLIDPDSDLKRMVYIYQLRKHSLTDDKYISKEYITLESNTNDHPTWYFATNWIYFYTPFYRITTIEDLKTKYDDSISVADPQHEMVKAEIVSTVEFIGGIKQDG